LCARAKIEKEEPKMTTKLNIADDGQSSKLHEVRDSKRLRVKTNIRAGISITKYYDWGKGTGPSEKTVTRSRWVVRRKSKK
jgi:hypothetical protein